MTHGLRTFFTFQDGQAGAALGLYRDVFDDFEGPVPRFGARGWGRSICCRDPSGNGIELISDEPEESPG